MKEAISKIIEQQVSKLSLREHIELIETLAHKLKEKSIDLNEKIDWKDLYGLGKGLWGKEDAQEYTNRLREDRI